MTEKKSNEDTRHPQGTPVELGDFRIIRLIGSGGMAQVYEAEQRSLKRRVALKVLPGHLSLHDEAIQRFQREAEAGSRQSHPGIVAIYAVGEHEGHHYIAEELVEGETSLADHLDDYRTQQPLPPGYFRECAALVLKVAEALDHAHGAGVIHRDVKPSNILIAPGGEPKVSDFGLAKIENALALSRTGDFLGTPFYMSPEQAMSHRIRIDHRTDVYSLGVTLYELLTLKRPFEGKTSQEVLKKIIFIEPKHPRRLDARVPKDLATICLKSMEKNPNHRYQNMAALIEDLRRYLQGDVVLARPVGWSVRLAKWGRRHPAVSLVAGVVFLAAVTVVLNWGWSISRIVAEQNKVQAINRFITQMLLSPHPDRDGRRVTVVEILDRAAKEVEGAFSDQPEVEAAIRNTLGDSYQALGVFAAAEKQQRIGYGILRKLRGDKHASTLRARADLAVTLLHQGRFAEAEPLLRTAFLGLREILGEDDADTLTAQGDLAGALEGLDRLTEAEAIYRVLVEDRTRLEGARAPDTLRDVNNLAAVLRRQERYGAAEVLLKEAHRECVAHGLADHTVALTLQSNLAGLYMDQDRHGAAETILADLLKMQTEKFGDRHEQVFTTLNLLAGVHLRLGRPAEAEAMSRKAWEGRCAVFGFGNPATLAAANRLVNILLLQKKYDEAEAMLKDPLVFAERELPAHHPERLMLHVQYGNCLARRRQFEKAEMHMLAYYNGFRQRSSNDRDEMVPAILNLIGFYECAGRKAKVEEYKRLLARWEAGETPQPSK